MSRIGKKPVELPKGVTVATGSDFFEVKDRKFELCRVCLRNYALRGELPGVTTGYKKSIRLEGTGYKAELKGSTLTLSLGLSHPVVFDVPKGLSVAIPGDSKNTVLQLETVDRDLLGKVVAQLQSFRPPEPYKGKGVRLMVDGSPSASPVLVKIRQKAGKAGKGKGK